MKILAIGDPHGEINKIKKIPIKNVNLIIITGDIGKANLARKMYFENIKRRKEGLKEKEYSKMQSKKSYMQIYYSTIKILKYLSKFAPVYLISGNVEHSNKEVKDFSRSIGLKLPLMYKDINKIKKVSLINNRIRNFKGVKIAGLKYFIDECWVKNFKTDNYSKSLKSARKQTKKAKKILKWFEEFNIDILITHQPPYGILDKVKNPIAPKYWQGKNAGSKVILDFIKKQKLKYVFCGHIHEGQGSKNIGSTHIYNLGVANHKIISFH